MTDIIQEIENKGLDMDGIYRISGNLAEVQKVRIQVDQGKLNFKDFDIHVLCGAFKTFFRELEEPLIPENLHESFLYYISELKRGPIWLYKKVLRIFNVGFCIFKAVTDQTKRFENIQELIRQMPMAHRETMRIVCEHLLKVVERSSENRMTVQNVALVFGPNIIRSNPIINSNQGFNPHIMTQNVLVEYILKNFRELYSFNGNQSLHEEDNYWTRADSNNFFFFFLCKIITITGAWLLNFQVQMYIKLWKKKCCNLKSFFLSTSSK